MGVVTFALMKGRERMTKGTARVATHVRPEDRDRLKQLAERHDPRSLRSSN
jgi:predicted kinase